MITLCHKCCGWVSGEGYADLNGCHCISSGTGITADSLESAAVLQVKREFEWVALYLSQGRTTERDFMICLGRIDRVRKLIPGIFGHGRIDWKRLAG